MSAPYALVSCEMTSNSFTPAFTSRSPSRSTSSIGPARQPAAHRGDDAEAALVVAALRDLQVRVMPRRQADALRGHEVQKRLVLRRQMLMDGRHDLFVGVRPRDLQDAGMPVEDALRLRAEAAGDDDAAVLLEGFADGIQRFVDGGIDEAAGVHDDDVRRVVARARLHTLPNAGA